MEAATSCLGSYATPSGDKQKGLKRGLWARPHTIVLMLDEIIITETPPLYCCYGRYGQQVSVPITGNRAKRIIHAASEYSDRRLAAAHY